MDTKMNPKDHSEKNQCQQAKYGRIIMVIRIIISRDTKIIMIRINRDTEIIRIINNAEILITMASEGSLLRFSHPIWIKNKLSKRMGNNITPTLFMQGRKTYSEAHSVIEYDHSSDYINEFVRDSSFGNKLYYW